MSKAAWPPHPPGLCRASGLERALAGRQCVRALRTEGAADDSLGGKASGLPRALGVLMEGQPQGIWLGLVPRA